MTAAAQTQTFNCAKCGAAVEVPKIEKGMFLGGLPEKFFLSLSYHCPNEKCDAVHTTRYGKRLEGLGGRKLKKSR